MKEYRPKYQGTHTVYVFVESPDVTPQDLSLRAYEAAPDLMIKETCFGLQITGAPERVAEVVATLRALDPSHIFVKDRGFPPGDPRRCRANMGGARPGFFGHEYELSLIRFISGGLEALARREAGDSALDALERKKKKPLDPDRLKTIFDAQEPSHG
ncbi:MAG: methanogenesis marker 6 protein [Methanomicrobiales archaeon]|nr:methanogenesis marker 6 protein [Methanomicrobiales archaeon]MDD1659681.1 methanogenesis marker 6 protein [Methanomicrobiales archaeon]